MLGLISDPCSVEYDPTVARNGVGSVKVLGYEFPNYVGYYGDNFQYLSPSMVARNNSRALKLRVYMNVNDRPVYHNDGETCIWWEKQFRHWWLGLCDQFGENNGFAYLHPDCVTPHVVKSGKNWKRGGSDQVLSLDSVYPVAASSDSFKSPNLSSAVST